MKAVGLVSGPTDAGRKSNYIFFVNNRLVDVPRYVSTSSDDHSLRRALEDCYKSALGTTKAFVYIAITVPRNEIDVNVHPTKQEIKMMREDELISMIRTTVKNTLAARAGSRTFVMPAVILPVPHKEPLISPSHFVRTDFRDQTIDSMFHKHKVRKLAVAEHDQTPVVGDAPLVNDVPRWCTNMSSAAAAVKNRGPSRPPLASVVGLIRQLPAAVKSVITESTLVGIIDTTNRQLLVQHNTQLYLVDFCECLRSYIYQQCLLNFGCHGLLHIEWDMGAKLGSETVAMGAMLYEYFSIQVSGA